MAIDTEKYLQGLGKNIVRIRESKKITQYKLAKELFMEQSNLARIERGKTNPTVKTLIKIADVLEASMEDLLIVSKKKN